MTRNLAILLLLLLAALAAAMLLGETPLTADQYAQAFTQPSSPSAEVIWSIRAPRALMAALVGAALGLAGAAMQGLLRNPLADPGVLGVSALSGLGAAAAIAAGIALAPGAIEIAALAGALVAGLIVSAISARFREPETLILFGVSLSAFGGALTALVFNFSPSPVTTAEVMSWLLGSVENRDWIDILRALIPMALGAWLCAWSARGLTMLTLGEETAALSGLPMARLRTAAVAGAALLTGAAVAASGVIGFVGLAAPHLVRRSAGDDPGKTLLPSAIAGAALLALADLVARLLPTEQELKLGVVTALFGAPLFALVAWRAARSWRSTGAAPSSAFRAPPAQAVGLVLTGGEVVGVLGPNGSGKTTLLRGGLGLLDAGHGIILWDDQPLADLSEAQRARLVGYLPQERHVGWNLSAQDIAALGAPDLTQADALAAARYYLAKVGLKRLVQRGVLDMSGGERARVLLARLLCTRAAVLIADEPAAGLDPDAQLHMLELLRAEAERGASVVVTLHDLTLAARFCDRLVVLKQGRAVADGPPLEALTPQVLREVFGLDGVLLETPAGLTLAARRIATG
jgi:iron complex transport system permease protein